MEILLYEKDQILSNANLKMIQMEQEISNFGSMGISLNFEIEQLKAALSQETMQKMKAIEELNEARQALDENNNANPQFTLDMPKMKRLLDKKDEALTVANLKLIQMEQEISNLGNIRSSLSSEIERLNAALSEEMLQKLKMIEEHDQMITKTKEQDNEYVTELQELEADIEDKYESLSVAKLRLIKLEEEIANIVKLKFDIQVECLSSDLAKGLQQKLEMVGEQDVQENDKLKQKLEKEKQLSSEILTTKLCQLETRSSSQVQEIVKNVIEINHLKEELENERKSNNSDGYGHLSEYSPYRSKYTNKKA